MEQSVQHRLHTALVQLLLVMPILLRCCTHTPTTSGVVFTLSLVLGICSHSHLSLCCCRRGEALLPELRDPDVSLRVRERER
jgi:hypothetical protein